jgi:hypothetical protein
VRLVQSRTIQTNQNQTMIIKDQTSEVEKIGSVSNESEFKMRTSQKAFQILSSLYSDKPLAIVRELGCNAMDSHIASGQPNRPFHIHVPNSLEPWLTIQDFGTGISHEDIYDIYSVYFASTKTNTNSQVGMLGLGSKSPFCYTDNFTITSIHNQVKRIYNAYFNSNGMPTISLASQTNTTEENGVAIQIPIKTSDFSNFSQAIWNSFRFFDVKPEITGGKIDWNTDKPDFEGTFWKSYTRLNTSYAIMGGVTYPIDIYKLDNDHYDIARKAGLVIHFNIGELDVTPSRESLMYHDWVIKALNDKIELVKKDFVQKVESTIKSSPNLIDALKAVYMLKDQWSFLNSSMINGKILWNNVEISDPRRSVKAIAPAIKCYSKRVWGRGKHTESEYPNFSNSTVWYYDNLPRGSVKRVIQFVRHNPNSDIAVNLVSESEMKNLIASGFPASLFIPTSTLDPITFNRVSGGTKSSKPKGIINLYSMGYVYSKSWDMEKFDLSTGTAPKYFVVKSSTGWDIKISSVKDLNGNVIVTPTTKSALNDLFLYLKISDKDVRMVSEGNAKHLEKLGSINLSTIVEKNKVPVDKEKAMIAKQINSTHIKGIIKNKRFASIDDNNPFKKFILELDQINDDVKKYQSMLRYIKIDEKKNLTFPSKMVEFLYLACESWQVGVDRTLDVLIEQQQTN